MLATTFIEITDENVSTTIAYIKDFLGNLTPFLLPIIAIGVGLIIFSVIVSTIKSR